MNSAQLTFDEMLELPNSTLHQIYHHAQLACVDATVNRDFSTAYSLLVTIIDARYIVMSRHGFDDRGHVQFYYECVEQRDNLYEFLTSPYQQRFRFTSGRLVGNAMDAGIFVPKSYRPVGWRYYQDYVRA